MHTSRDCHLGNPTRISGKGHLNFDTSKRINKLAFETSEKPPQGFYLISRIWLYSHRKVRQCHFKATAISIKGQRIKVRSVGVVAEGFWRETPHLKTSPDGMTHKVFMIVHGIRIPPAARRSNDVKDNTVPWERKAFRKIAKPVPDLFRIVMLAFRERSHVGQVQKQQVRRKSTPKTHAHTVETVEPVTLARALTTRPMFPPINRMT